MMWDYGYYGYPGMGAFGWILMVLFWAAVIWLVFWIVTTLIRRGRYDRYDREDRDIGNHHMAPLEILRERYAKGEIAKKEYDEMKKELKE